MNNSGADFFFLFLGKVSGESVTEVLLPISAWERPFLVE